MEASKRKAENGWFISRLINVSRENSRHAWISQKVSSIWTWLRYKWNKWRQESETGPGLWNTRLLWRHWLCQHAQTWQAEGGRPEIFETRNLKCFNCWMSQMLTLGRSRTTRSIMSMSRCLSRLWRMWGSDMLAKVRSLSKSATTDWKVSLNECWILATLKLTRFLIKVRRQAIWLLWTRVVRWEKTFWSIHISQPIPSYRPGCGATTTMVNLALVTPDAGALAQSKRKAEIHHEKNTVNFSV